MTIKIALFLSLCWMAYSIYLLEKAYRQQAGEYQGYIDSLTNAQSKIDKLSRRLTTIAWICMMPAPADDRINAIAEVLKQDL